MPSTPPVKIAVTAPPPETDVIESVAAANDEERRERQQFMLQRMPGFAALLVGSGLRFDYVNDAVRAFAGERPLLGRSIRDVFPDRAARHLRRVLHRIYRRGASHRAGAVRLAFDGTDEERFVDVVCEPVRNDRGEVTALFVAGHDVTAQALVERRRDAVVALQDRLRDVTDTADVSFVTGQALGAALGTMRAGYGLLDPVAGTLHVERDWHAPGVASVVGLHRIDDYGSYRGLQGGDAVASDDVETDPRTIHQVEAFRAIGVRAFLDVPFIENGRLVGQLFVHSATRRRWTAEEITFVRHVAERTRSRVARRQAELDLVARESELRFTLEAGRFGTWTLELESGELTTSATCRTNFGRDPLEAFDYEALRDSVHVDDRARIVDAIERSIASRADYDLEHRVVTPIGEVRWVHVRAQPTYAADGTPLRMTGVTMDVTARRRAEAELRDLNETLEQRIEERSTALRLYQNIVQSDAARIVAFDHDWRVIAFNPAHALDVRRVFGHEARLGDVLPDLFVADQAIEVRAWMLRALAGETFTVRASLGDPATGTIEWEITYNPLRDEAGRIVGAFQHAVDIAAQLGAEAELAAAQEQLRQSLKMEAMGQLMGGVAHDFNNLLTPIVGALDLLQRRGLGDERVRRLIAGAAQSSERARTLVQRLLAFARRQPLQLVAVDVAQLVGGMAELIGSTMGPQTRVLLETPLGLPPAEADPNQLEMALLNLAVNARDAMPDGGTLRITAGVASADDASGLKAGRYLRLSVADTGVGMEDATLARAIEPFFSTKGVGKGTGLGLSMVHGLASQLGGALTMRSRPGLGTEVELWLPQSNARPASLVTSPETVPKTQPKTEPAPRRGTVLLVDDEELVRLTTADMLGDLGYRIVEAASAEEALDVIDRGTRIDIVVTDHLMPGMTGTDLARTIRARRPGFPVLVVSGYAKVEGIAPDLPRLAKPFRKDELAASLASL